jgi:HAD superfamily hydrolase (TIGR01549 family)
MHARQQMQSSWPKGERTPWTAVLFDFGGTLDANGIAWKERFFRLYQEEGVGLSTEQFDQAFYAADDALVGAIPVTLSFQDTVMRLVWGVTHALDLQDGTLVERIATRFVDEARDQLSTNARLLELLSGQYGLGIVSNFYGNLTTVCHEMGLSPFLTVVVDSAHVGCVKPDPRIFLLALEALRADPAQAVFVGDSLGRDMAGARGIGMAHVWLTAGTAPGEGPCCPNDPVVHTLDELRELLL